MSLSNDTIFKKGYLVFLCVLGILMYACNSGPTQSNEKQSTVEADTLFEAIKQGRDTKLSYNKRKTYLDKAYTAALHLKNDSLKTKVFSRLSLAYLILNDSLNFRKSNLETIRLARKVKDSTSLAEANWDLADFYRLEAIADSAYYHFSEAEKIYHNLGQNYESARMLYNMAIAQADVKDYTASEITTIKAIEILKPLNKHEQLYSSYSNLGSVSKDLKEYERAIDYYNIALDYQKQIQTENTFDLSLKNNIGVVYQNKGEYAKSLPYFEQVLSEKNLITKYPKLYALSLNNLAYSRFKINPRNDVSEQFQRAVQIQDSIGDIAGASRTHYGLAEYYLTKKDTLKALSHAKKALSDAETAHNNDRLLQTLQLLTRLDPKNSSTYNSRYISLNDSLQEEERQVRDKFARIRFETDEYIAENETLASEKRLWAGIALAIFLLAASAFIMFDQRAKNQKLRFQQAQQAANQEIFNLMLAQKEKVEEGKKSEQKRISEELHDGVLGRMMGSRMVLTGLNKKNDQDAEAQRKKAIDALQDVEKEIRAISHELSDAAYQKMHNFMLSLQDLLKSVESTANINCKLVYDHEKNWDALKGDIKINVYRMVQESLQNSVKHAQCKNVTVTFASDKNTLKVAIMDDGRGFRTTKRKKGIGMRNIASRIEKLHGEWNIDSTPGKGTTIVLEIPVTSSKNSTPRSTGKRKLTEEV